ncbi:MAG: hypothetical protein HYY45_16080 [Deltaproteobacteria bacterium]|nr:hypothetical protein [Deltaproteobacteria bacterium]
MYESMGLEVRLEPVQAEDLACSQCLPGPGGTFGDCYVIYTRPRGNGEDKEFPGRQGQKDELW